MSCTEKYSRKKLLDKKTFTQRKIKKNEKLEKSKRKKMKNKTCPHPIPPTAAEIRRYARKYFYYLECKSRIRNQNFLTNDL